MMLFRLNDNLFGGAIETILGHNGIIHKAFYGHSYGCSTDFTFDGKVVIKSEFYPIDAFKRYFVEIDENYNDIDQSNIGDGRIENSSEKDANIAEKSYSVITPEIKSIIDKYIGGIYDLS
jgi:hypothetical protein